MLLAWSLCGLVAVEAAGMAVMQAAWLYAHSVLPGVTRDVMLPRQLGQAVRATHALRTAAPVSL